MSSTFLPLNNIDFRHSKLTLDGHDLRDESITKKDLEYFMDVTVSKKEFKDVELRYCPSSYLPREPEIKVRYCPSSHFSMVPEIKVR